MLKAILASLTGFGSDRTVMDAAYAVAQIDHGHIEVLHTRIDAAEMAASAIAMTSQNHADVREMAKNIALEEQERSGSAKKAYSDACARHSISQSAHTGRTAGVTASYREVTTLMNETLHQARLHDLTIVARVAELAADRLDSLVMSAGKPILIPPAKPGQIVGETVVIAWKDKPEAARAITASLPILTHAKHVTVVSVSESKIDQDGARSSGEGLVAQLKWHGIEAQLQFAPTASVPAAEKIKEIAYGVDADLIVMGAYGHNRMRELFFGGATRDLLTGCDTAVLMIH